MFRERDLDLVLVRAAYGLLLVLKHLVYLVGKPADHSVVVFAATLEVSRLLAIRRAKQQGAAVDGGLQENLQRPRPASNLFGIPDAEDVCVHRLVGRQLVVDALQAIVGFGLVLVRLSDLEEGVLLLQVLGV